MTEARKAVWIVDDEPDVLTYLLVALEDHGFRVRAFSGAEGFLEEARQAPPDLVCLDIMMPNRSGLSLYVDIRKEEALRGVPILIVSGYSRPGEVLRDEFRRLIGDAGVTEPEGFLEKPIILDDFLARVRTAVSGAGT